MKAHDGKGLRKLGLHEISLRWYRDKTSQICFNQHISTLVKNAKLTKCFVSVDTSYNRLFFVFTNTEGFNFRFTGVRFNNLTVTAWKLTSEVVKFFKIDSPDTYRLHVSDNLSKTDNCITIQAIKHYKLSDLQGDSLKDFYNRIDISPEEKPLEDKKNTKKKEQVKFKSPKKEKELGELNEEECIKFLKSKGYKILKQVTEFVEV